jgi:zinc protease
MHNGTPKDGVAMRLRIGSGSLAEADDQQGLAHFLEHMAFRGSTNFPDGEVVRTLERQGLSFGPDTNAATSPTETVYKFNFPKSDPGALDCGLKLFREIGDQLTLAPSAIDQERGVILSEQRVRDTPAYRALTARLDAVLDGTRAVDRWTIGTTGTIERADRDRLSRYYKLNYRPDNATVVVVGNVDTAAAEQKIRAIFSDWRAPPAAPPLQERGVPTASKPVAEFVGPSAPSELVLSWVRPRDRRPDTEAVERELLLDRIALGVLNQRLAERSLAPDSPIVGAHANSNRSLFHSASVTEISAITVPGRWHDALDEITGAERLLLRDGVLQSELQRAIQTIRMQVQAEVAAEATRKSADIADRIVNSIDSDSLFDSAAQKERFILPLLGELTARDVDSRLSDLFGSGGPLLFLSGSRAPIDRRELAYALSVAYTRPLGRETREAQVAWPYADFGAAGAAVSRADDRQLGVTTVRFANGSRLLVKPTKFEKGRVEVAVSLGGGRAALDRNDARKLWEVSFFPLGGTKKLSFEQITRWAQAEGKVASVRLNAGVRSFVLSGNTRSGDLLTEMQLLCAYARDPGFRLEAADKAKSMASLVNGHIANSPSLAFERGTQAYFVGNDPRFELLPSPSDLANVATDDLPSLLKDALASRADVVIVGDVTVGDAVAATRATFGAGSRLPDKASPAAQIAAPVQGRTEQFEYRGRADQAVVGEYFILPDHFAAPRDSLVARVAAAILKGRLVDKAREKLGMTYSPNVVAVSSPELEGEAYLGAMIETPPSNFARFKALLGTEIADLASRPVSSDELERAKRPLIDDEIRKRETNAFWTERLVELARDPRLRAETLGEMGDLSSVTSADVQELVRTFIADRQPTIMIARASGAQKFVTVGVGARQ